jgi:hypothetical protein
MLNLKLVKISMTPSSELLSDSEVLVYPLKDLREMLETFPATSSNNSNSKISHLKKSLFQLLELILIKNLLTLFLINSPISLLLLELPAKEEKPPNIREEKLEI